MKRRLAVLLAAAALVVVVIWRLTRGPRRALSSAEAGAEPHKHGPVAGGPKPVVKPGRGPLPAPKPAPKPVAKEALSLAPRAGCVCAPAPATAPPVCARGGMFDSPCAAECFGAQAADITPAKLETGVGLGTKPRYSCTEQPILPADPGGGCTKEGNRACIFGQYLGNGCQARKRLGPGAKTYMIARGQTCADRGQPGPS